jgi:HD-like signal output (HDOD) protein/CheY-like chemotaxis protein
VNDVDHETVTRDAVAESDATPASVAGQQALAILLVEDSATDRALIEHFFADPSLLGTPAALTVATDADAALAAIRGHTRFAAILLDYSLPGRDGLEVLRDLRTIGDRTPVIMITGTGDEGVAVQALRQGASDYVVKRVGFERALPVVIERALRNTALELEVARARQQEIEYTRRLEQTVEDQTRSLQRALQESEALRRVGRTLAASRELQPALDMVARAAVEITQAQAGAVILRSGSELALVSAWGALDQPRGTKSRELCVALDRQMRETAIVPLREAQAEIGLLWIGRVRFQPFGRHDRELLESLADATALAIANLRAHERLRRIETAQAERDVAAPSDLRTGSAPTVASARDDTGADAAATAAGAAARGAREPSVSPAGTSGAPEPAASTMSRPAGSRRERVVVPSFSPALARIIQLDDDPDASPEAVADAAALDPALATRAIQLASSAGLGRARPASSLREALVVIGLRAIRNLAFAQFARGLLTRRGPIDELLWEQSLATAVGTQLVLELSQPGLAEDGYLCGLLHNLGEVALNNTYPEQYHRAIAEAIASGRPIREVQEALLPVGPAPLLQQLLASWPLPTRIVRVLMGRPSRVDEALTLALGWARAIAWRTNPAWRALLGERAEPPWVEDELAAAESTLAVSVDVLAAVRERIEERQRMYRTLLS